MARWPWQSTSLRQQVVAEAEAVLAGATLSRRNPDVAISDWSIVSVLAHGQVRQLRAAEREHCPSDMTCRDPWTTLGALAHDLLAACARDASVLLSIQRERLVPLELELLRRQLGESLTIPQLVTVVQRILDGRPNAWVPEDEP
jgi:hypothetical protein